MSSERVSGLSGINTRVNTIALEQWETKRITNYTRNYSEVSRVSNVTSLKKMYCHDPLYHEILVQLIVIARIGLPVVYILCHSDFRVSTSVLRPE